MESVHKHLLEGAGFLPDYVESHKSVIYIVESELRIVYCNAYWDEFALANDGEKLLRAHIRGECVLDVIPDPLKSYYRDGFRGVQETGNVWEHDFECSSPKQFRQFHMRVTRLAANHTLVENSLRVERQHGAERPAMAPSEHVYATVDGTVTMCMHCRRTKRATEFPERLNELADMVWDWVPSFVEKPPNCVSHGLCRMCYPEFFRYAKS